MGVKPTPLRFQTCYLIRPCNPFEVYLSARCKDKKAFFLSHGIDNVFDWERYHVFVDRSSDRPFNFATCTETLPFQTNYVFLNPDAQIIKLNTLFANGTFNLPKLCTYTPLLAFWRINPDAHLARGLDLGDCSLFSFLYFITFRLFC